MSDAVLARLAAASYTAPPTWTYGDVHAVLTDNVLAFRGTVPTVLADWLRDLDCVPEYDRKLGYCHRGFLSGALGLLKQVPPGALAMPLIVTGHSLGGALAITFAGIMATLGRPPVSLVTFGAPRAGFQGLRKALAGVPCRQYHHGADPVPDVPLPYQHIALPLIQVGTASDNPIGDHSIALYAASIEAKENTHA